MPEKRVTVWVTSFPDRKNLMLQWKDPDTNKVKSKSAQTADPKEAESRRVDLESDLNNGRYAEASRMSWERFRELFEEEFLPGRRPSTRDNYRDRGEVTVKQPSMERDPGAFLHAVPTHELGAQAII